MNESDEGAVQDILMLFATTSVVGAAGAAGTIAVRMVIGSDSELKPTELRA